MSAKPKKRGFSNPNQQITSPDQDPQDNPDVAAEIKKIIATLKVTARYRKKHFGDRADRQVSYYKLNHYFDPINFVPPENDFERIKICYPYANARQILAEIYVKTPEPVVKPHSPTYQMKGEKTQQAQGQSGQPGMPPGPQNPQSPQNQAQVSPPGMMPPQEFSSYDAAQSLKECILYCVRKSNLKYEAKMAVLDGVVTGEGVIFGPMGQKHSKVPKYERVLYKNILYSADVTNVYKSPWVARKLVRDIDDVKDDESYDAEARKRVEPNGSIDTNLISTNSSEVNEVVPRYVILWDYWDKKHDRHLVFPDNASYALLDEKVTDKFPFKTDDDDFECDWPFTFFINEETVDEAYGIGDLAPIEPLVRELDKARTQQSNHRKRFNRKYAVKKDVLDEQGMFQLKNPEDGTIVEFKGDIVPSNFQPIADAPLSPDVYKVDEQMEKAIQIISPLGPNSLVRGVGQQPDTLGQAELIEQNSDTRLDEKRDKVAEVFKRVFRLTAEYIQEYWVEEDDMLVNGTGENPQDWLHYSPDKIQGEFEYEVDPETLRDNTAVYRRQATDALQIISPILGPIYPQGVFELIRKALATYDWIDLDKIIPEHLVEQGPPPPPPPPPPPGPHPSELVSFKDLPPLGKIQMAAQAGIRLEPDDFGMPAPGIVSGGQMGSVHPPQSPQPTMPQGGPSVNMQGPQGPSGQPQAPLTPAQQHLLQVINSTPPKQFLDTLHSLPQNEQKAIEMQIHQLQALTTPGAPQPQQPNQPM